MVDLVSRSVRQVTLPLADGQGSSRYGLLLPVTRVASQPPPAVAQVTLPEPQYRAHAHALAAALSGPHCRGVWEDRLPVTLPALLTLGCCAEVAPAARGRPLGGLWTLDQLKV